MIGHDNSMALKNAGLPQPTPDLGQHWYSCRGQLYIIGRLSPKGGFKAVATEDTSWEHLQDMNGFVFAPTSEDILKELQKSCRNGFLWNLIPPSRVDSRWSCNCVEVGYGTVLHYSDTVPVFACVEAFLSIERIDQSVGYDYSGVIQKAQSVGIVLQEKADQLRHDKSVEALMSADLSGLTSDEKLAKVSNILDHVDEQLDGE